MYKLKYRRQVGGQYLVTELPDDAELFLGVDKNGREVYEGDLIKRISYIDDMGDAHEVLESYPLEAAIEDYGAIRDEEMVKCE